MSLVVVPRVMEGIYNSEPFGTREFRKLAHDNIMLYFSLLRQSISERIFFSDLSSSDMEEEQPFLPPNLLSEKNQRMLSKKKTVKL